MNRFFSSLIILSSLLFFNCNNKKDKITADTDALYFDYKITAEEGNDNLTVLLQYRYGDEEGEGVSITEPGKVMLDGEALVADSTQMNGTFYEINKPIEGFAGKHNIVFIDINKKEYKEEFDFAPLVLATQIADTISKDSELVLGFEGVKEGDEIMINFTDTSYINEGINKKYKVANGRIIITPEEMKAVSSGPVQLQLVREQEGPVQNGAKQGGKIMISYMVKREFLLKD